MWRPYATAARLSRRACGRFEVSQVLGPRAKEPQTSQWLAAAACVLLAGSVTTKDQRRTHADEAPSSTNTAGTRCEFRP